MTWSVWRANLRKQDLAWVGSGPRHTLFDHGLIQRVNVSRFDVFASIFLESGQPISNAVWRKCRNKLKTSHQNPTLAGRIQAVRE